MSRHKKEQLDFVNEENVVIGQADRQEIHDKNLLHRAVHLILTTGSGLFLLQKRSDSTPTYSERWDSSVSGHVSAGANFDQTVVREAKEEIGYATDQPVHLLLIEGSPDTDFEWIQFYTERVTHPPDLRANPDEIKDLRWWEQKKLVEALVQNPDQFTPAFRMLFFLWRQTGFLIPEKQKGNWYSIASGNANELQVRRGLLESAGLDAQVEQDQHWLAPQGGRAVFGGRREARHTVLCVPRETLPDAVALLYLSLPEDAATPADPG